MGDYELIQGNEFVNIKIEDNKELEKDKNKQEDKNKQDDPWGDVEILEDMEDKNADDPYEPENPDKIYSPLISRFRKVDAMHMNERLIEVTEEELKFTTQKRVSSIASYRHDDLIKYNTDTASLGSKSVKNNTPYKRARNATIDSAKKIHKDATAYTLETYDKINNLLAERREKAEKSNISPEERRTAIIKRLSRVNFTTQMFYSTNIRNNLSLYLSYIYDYDEAVASESDVYQDELDALKKSMDLFKERVQMYCESNKIKLDGKAIPAGHRTSRLTPDKLLMWSRQVKYTKARVEYDPEKERENIVDLKQEAYGREAEPEIIDLALLSTTKQRVRNVNKLGISIKLIQDKIDLIERSKEYKKRYGKDEGSQADYKAYVSEYAFLVKQKALYTAYYSLAYKENRYFAHNNEVSDEELKSAYEDMCSIEESMEKYDFERFKKDKKVRVSRSVDSLSKGDAILGLDSVTESSKYREDMLWDFEHRIREILRTVLIGDRTEKKKLTALADMLSNCQKHDMFYKGRSDEISYIKKLMNMANELHNDESITTGAAKKVFTDILSYLEESTNGTLVVPRDADVLDYSEQEPQNAGVKFKGYKRNAVLQSISYYSDQTQTPLFAHEPTALDFKQNVITNCYLCSAMTSLVEMSPKFIKNMLRDNNDGTVTVRLYQEIGQFREMSPVYIRVKKTVPKIAGGDYASGGALWMQMIEKAIAVLGNKRDKNGYTRGYAGLWYGKGYDILPVLTGVKSRRDETMNPNRDYQIAFEELMDWKQNKKIYTAGSKDDAKMVQPGHAYAVLGGRISNGERLVKLRNPYSRASSDYEYGKDAETLSKTGMLGTMDFLGGEGDDFGVFEMKYEDFINEFSSVWSSDFKEAEEHEEAEKLDESVLDDQIKYNYDDDDDDFLG